MRRYRVVVQNSWILFAASLIIALATNAKYILVYGVIITVANIICLLAMLHLSKLGYYQYSLIPKWKHIRNCVIYTICIWFGIFVGFQLHALMLS